MALTGNRALPGFTAPKLLWMRRHEPDLYARIERVCLPKDYVRLRLCGEWATDVSDASGTVLLDVAERRWSEPMLEQLDIDPSILPPVLESPEPSGETDAGVPVVAGAGDQAAGAVGVGVTTAGPASVVLGTSGVVFAALDRYASDPAGRVHAFCHAIPGTWHAMGVMLSAAGALQWLHDVTDSSLPFDELTAEAARWGPGVEGLTFLPYLAGERTPYPDPDARGAFAGLSLRHDRGALVRAVLEGVAFGLRDGLDLVVELGGAISFRPRLRWRCSQRSVAPDPRLGPRAPARSRQGRRRRCVRRRAARGRRRRDLARRPGCGRGNGVEDRADRADPRLG